MTEVKTVDRVLVEVVIAAPAGDVWDAIRNPQKIYNWFGWDAATLEDEIDFIFNKSGRADEAKRTLRFEGTTDRFEVEERGGESVLRVIRAAPAGESWESVYEDMTEGWISFVQQLRFAVKRHAIGPRRTIYLSGNVKPGGTGPIDGLGLAGLRALPDGETFDVELPTGDRISGEAWHRSPWQVGCTVAQWGDGLLVVTDQSATDAAPHGRGVAVLTTYGLSDEAFARTEASWKAWWETHYESKASAQDACP